jgi:rifampicin phosphotransferase
MSINAEQPEKQLIFRPTVATSEKQIGGKAVGLARLCAAELQVPDFFVIPCDWFREHLKNGGIPSALGSAMLTIGDHEGLIDIGESQKSISLRGAVEDEPIAASLRNAIVDALDKLGEGPYAVRSSMVGEDSAHHSFAGQLDSYLYQTNEQEVIEAVRRCWGSALDLRTLIYADRAGLSPTEIRMGVIVQKMIDADVSGVLFTANPLNGRRDQCLTTAAYGLGEGIVSGVCNTDEYVWTEGKGEQSLKIATKDVKVVRSSTGAGTEEVSVLAPGDKARALSQAQVSEVCQVGLGIAEDIGMADVEWCYAKGQLHVLQARPITSLGATYDPEGITRVFDNSNIQESFCGVTTPLTFSFASHAYTVVFRQFAVTLGASQKTLRDFEPSAQNMISLVRGRVYYNLGSWYNLLRILPKFKRNKEDTEKVMWHLDESVEPATENATLASKIGAWVGAARVGGRLLLRFVRLDTEIERFVARFNSIYEDIDREHLASASLSELYEASQHLSRELLEKWETPNINDFRVMISCGRLRRMLETRCGEGAEARLADLLGGIDGIESVRPTQLLIDIATQASLQPEIASVVRKQQPRVALAECHARFPDFARRIDDYIDRYGDRCIGELKLETVSLRDDPAFVFNVLRNYIEHDDLDGHELSRRDRERFSVAYKELRSQLSWLGKLRLRRQVARARNAVKARETLRLLRTYAFGVARDIFRAMGHRLHEAGVLENPRDVFYLTVDELLAFQEGRAVTTNLAQIAAVRKAEYVAYEYLELPDHFKVIGSPYLAKDYGERGEQIIPDTDILQGLGCCAGVVEAPVRLIFSPADELSVNDQILCTVRTDPGWAPLFPTARGLIVERGSALSHSAVVARELGIPTVVGIEGVTRILVDGESVRLDGEHGTVERIVKSEDS